MTEYKITDAIEAPKGMLTLTGVWPVEGSSFMYRLRNLMTYTNGLLLFTVMTLEVVHSIQDILSLSDILFIYFEFFAYAIKLTTFQWNRKKLFGLTKKLQDPLLYSFDEKHSGYVRNAIWQTNFIGNAFKLNSSFVILFLGLRPFIEDKIYPIPFSFYPKGFMWHIIYFIQISGLALVCWNHIGLDTLCVGYIGIAIAELDILCEKLKGFGTTNTIGNENSELFAQEYLKNCCKHHSKVMEFVKNIEEVFTKGILGQYFSSVIIICNSGFHVFITPVASTQFVTLTLYFGAMMIELVMYCWFGNEVILKSLEISKSCYMSKWYKFSPRTNKIIFMIMEMSKRPLTISAYKFSVLSLTAFLTIIQCSYSYFAVLRRLYMDD